MSQDRIPTYEKYHRIWSSVGLADQYVDFVNLYGLDQVVRGTDYVSQQCERDGVRLWSARLLAGIRERWAELSNQSQRAAYRKGSKDGFRRGVRAAQQRTATGPRRRLRRKDAGEPRVRVVMFSLECSARQFADYAAALGGLVMNGMAARAAPVGIPYDVMEAMRNMPINNADGTTSPPSAATGHAQTPQTPAQT